MRGMQVTLIKLYKEDREFKTLYQDDYNNIYIEFPYPVAITIHNGYTKNDTKIFKFRDCMEQIYKYEVFK